LIADVIFDENAVINNRQLQPHGSCIIRAFMKCPKCGYLGFEPVDRCRNCGYDFSLLVRPDQTFDPELRKRAEAAVVDPLADLTLVADGAAASARAPSGSPQRERGAASRSTAVSGTPPDLPLFSSRLPDDEPLITRPSPPRPPLAVRRATPEMRRVRPDQPRVPPLDLTLDAADGSTGSQANRSSILRTTVPGARGGDGMSWGGTGLADVADVRYPDAAVSARVVAVVIDLLILATIDVTVIYFTMQICGITVEELGLLPKVPLATFLLVQNGGYLVAFTVGGQTLGKMAVDIRVVPAGEEDTLDVSRACLRTLLWVLLAVPAGLGFLTTLLSRDRRGLHDRCAGTRVVRASA
jgi:uncharacterized RDD family membrane protein YckC